MFELFGRTRPPCPPEHVRPVRPNMSGRLFALGSIAAVERQWAGVERRTTPERARYGLVATAPDARTAGAPRAGATAVDAVPAALGSGSDTVVEVRNYDDCL